MNYHHLMLGDEQYIKAVNEDLVDAEYNRKKFEQFDKANPPIPYYGPAFEGVKTEEEIDIVEQFQSKFDFGWHDIDKASHLEENGLSVAANMIARHYEVRQAARLKEQPNRSEIPNSSESKKQIISEVMEADEKDGLYEEQPVQQEEYYLLKDGDIILPGDEYLGSDNITWHNSGNFSNEVFDSKVFVPHRRKIQPSTHIVEEQREEKLKVIKEKVAKKYGYANWEELYCFNGKIIDDVLDLYLSPNREEELQNEIEELKKALTIATNSRNWNREKLLQMNREDGRELQDFIEAGIEKAKTKKPFDSFWEGWLGALIHVKMNYVDKLSPSSPPLEQKELKDITDEPKVLHLPNSRALIYKRILNRLK